MSLSYAGVASIEASGILDSVRRMNCRLSGLMDDVDGPAAPAKLNISDRRGGGRAGLRSSLSRVFAAVFNLEPPW